MMADQVIEFTLEGNAANLLDELQKIPGMTRKEARKMVSEIRKASKQAAKAAQKNAKASRDHWQKSQLATAEGFRKMASVAQGQTGRITSAVLDAGEALTAFGKVLGPGGAIALGLVAAAAGFVIIAAVAIKANVALAQFVATQAEVLDDAEKMKALGSFINIDPAEEQSLRRVQSAMADIGLAVEAVTLQVAALMAQDLAPVIEVIAAMATDAARSLDAWAETLSKAGHASGILRGDLLDLAVSWRLVSAAGAEATRRGTANAAAARAVQASHDGAAVATKKAKAAQDALNAANKIAADVMKDLLKVEKEADKVQKERDDRNKSAADKRIESQKALAAMVALTLVGTQKATAAELERSSVIATAKARGLSDAELELATDANLVLSSQELAKVNQGMLDDDKTAHEERVKMANEAMEKEEEKRENEKRWHQEVMDEARAEAQLKTDLAFSIADTAATLADVVASRAKAGSKAQRKAAMASFAITKAAGLAQIAVDTVVASVAALKLPWPMNAIVSATIIAQGVASAAIVAAKPPPSFHLGGTPAGTGALAQPDVVSASILSSEEVVTQEESRRRAAAGGGDRRTVLQIGHQVYDDMTTKALRTPSSPMSRAMNAGKHPGRGAYRGG